MNYTRPVKPPRTLESLFHQPNRRLLADLSGRSFPMVVGEGFEPSKA
ncbi:MAG: hypothetical protein WDO68_12605 [Gammaproteobacteria bacterium]